LIWFRIFLYSVSIVLILVLQKRHLIDYDFDAEELKRMMIVEGGRSNLEEGDKAAQEVVLSPSGQPESRNPLGSVHLVEILISDRSSERLCI